MKLVDGAWYINRSKTQVCKVSKTGNGHGFYGGIITYQENGRCDLYGSENCNDLVERVNPPTTHIPVKKWLWTRTIGFDCEIVTRRHYATMPDDDWFWIKVDGSEVEE